MYMEVPILEDNLWEFKAPIAEKYYTEKLHSFLTRKTCIVCTSTARNFKKLSCTRTNHVAPLLAPL